MTYKEAVNYIMELPKFTTKNDLSHTARFLEELGNPEENRKVIHVAGTNGKGSVCVYIESMIRSVGQSTGLFVSPHLIKVNERIVLNGEQVSDEEFLRVFEVTLAAVNRMQEKGIPHPTFFEFFFGMAMKAFADADVRYIILETGLGGRLDATSAIVNPALTVITSLSLDHTEYLGDTIEKIAAEKAGILRKNVPFIYISSGPAADRVLEEHAEALQAPCRKISKSAYEMKENQDKYIAFSCADAYYEDTTWKLSNIGRYQADNAMLALEAVRLLYRDEKHLPEWQKALEEVHWAGRMEEILPGVYVDGAHNVDAVEAFVKSVPKTVNGNIVLFSAVQDKNYEKMIACLCAGMDAEEYIVTTIADKRAADAGKLGNVFRQNAKCKVTVKQTIEEAFQYTLEQQGDRTVYCLGSLYLVGTIKEWI